MIKLKQTDLRLLTYLYQHNRESIAKIAKTINLSREQVDYRIKKYEADGIIKSYVPIIRYSKLGYNNLIILMIKFQKPSCKEEFHKSVVNDKHRISSVEILAKYDYGMLLIFKDEREKNEYIMKLLEKNKKRIADHHVVEPYHINLYPLKIIDAKNNEGYIWIDYHKGEAKIDEKDRKILYLLNKNARMRIIDIAEKTNLSAELIIYKLKKLRKEGIFLGSRTVLNVSKLGYYYTALQINMEKLSQSISERLADFAKKSPNIDTFYLSITKPNCQMQLFHKDEAELREVIKNLKKAFSEESFSIEILPIASEGEDINTIPFI